LFYRLNVLPIHLPPLRERAEDIPELALHFLHLYCERMNKQVAGIDDDALACLKAYPWPGNIRQLENAIQHAVVIAEKPLVTIEELPAELRSDFSTPFKNGVFPGEAWEDSLDETIRDVTETWSPPPGMGAPPALLSMIQNGRAERERRERDRFVRALAAAGGNKSEAARALGLARTTFFYRLKRLGLT
jgi:DNA-binding NtrC family response regulator